MWCFQICTYHSCAKSAILASQQIYRNHFNYCRHALSTKSMRLHITAPWSQISLWPENHKPVPHSVCKVFTGWPDIQLKSAWYMCVINNQWKQMWLLKCLWWNTFTTKLPWKYSGLNRCILRWMQKSGKKMLYSNNIKSPLFQQCQISIRSPIWYRPRKHCRVCVMRFGARGKKEIKNNLIQFEGEVKEKTDVLSIPIDHTKKASFIQVPMSYFFQQAWVPHIISIITIEDCVTVLVLGKGKKIPSELLVHY